MDRRLFLVSFHIGDADRAQSSVYSQVNLRPASLRRNWRRFPNRTQDVGCHASHVLTRVIEAANCSYFVQLWRLIPKDFLCFQRRHDFDSDPRLQILKPACTPRSLAALSFGVSFTPAKRLKFDSHPRLQVSIPDPSLRSGFRQQAPSRLLRRLVHAC